MSCFGIRHAQMYNKIQHGVLRFPPFLSEDCKSLIVQVC